jgi:UDP-N-acetylenolpyruvoylglucosamine reductase
LGGLDFLAAIPGTIGGAAVTRAHYQDKQIASYARGLSVFWPAAPTDADRIVHLPIDALAWRLIETAARADNPYPPVVVSVTLQFALVHQDTLVRRLQTIRQQRTPHKERALGYIFSEPTNKIALDRDQSRRITSLDFDRYDRNIVRYHQRLHSTRALRQQLEEWRQVLNEQRSDPLDYRLSFLGYWPDEEGDQTVNR